MDIHSNNAPEHNDVPKTQITTTLLFFIKTSWLVARAAMCAQEG
jgi:hypothetical protein